MCRRTLCAVLTAALGLGALASPAVAQPVVVNWVGPNGSWDNGVNWAMGAAVEPYPFGDWGTDFDCLLNAGAAAVVRQDVNVWGVLNQQALRMVSGAELMVYADPLDPFLMGRAPLYNQDLLEGNGTVLARKTDNTGSIAAQRFDHDLRLEAGEIVNQGSIYAINTGVLTLSGSERFSQQRAQVNNAAGVIYAQNGGELYLEECDVVGGTVEARALGVMHLSDTDLSGQILDVLEDGTLVADAGDNAVDHLRVAGPTTAGPARVIVEDEASLHVRQTYESVGAPGTDNLIFGQLEFGSSSANANVQTDTTLQLQGGRIQGYLNLLPTCFIKGWGTIDADDLSFGGGGTPPEIWADSSDALTISGHVYGHGYVKARPDSWLVFDECTLELPDHKKFLIETGATCDAYDSSLISPGEINRGEMYVYDTTFVDEDTSTGYQIAMGGDPTDPGLLSIEQGYCHIAGLDAGSDCHVRVMQGATLEIDDLNLHDGGTMTVYGTAQSYEPMTWDGDEMSPIYLDGGRIEGQTSIGSPIVGHGQMHGDFYLGGGSALFTEGGVLELEPYTDIQFEAWQIGVAPESELFINGASIQAYEASIEVLPLGILRLHDATFDPMGWMQCIIGGMMPVGDGVGAFAPGERGAEMICTGENEMTCPDVIIQWGSQAVIESGTTTMVNLVNCGRVTVCEGATLDLSGEPFEGYVEQFVNDYDAEFTVGGTLNLQFDDGYGYYCNDGLIAIQPSGVVNLWGDLEGEGTIAVEGLLSCNDVGYWGGGYYTIEMDGGTITGCLTTDHRIHGYGTIAASVSVVDNDVVNDEEGRILHITDSTVSLFGEGAGELRGENGALIEIEDSVIMGSNRFLLDGGMLRGDGYTPTRMLIRDSDVWMDGVVRGTSELACYGAVEMTYLDVREEAYMDVHGCVALEYLGIGTPDPEHETQGGGDVYILPCGRLTLSELEVHNQITVAGELAFWEDEGGAVIHGPGEVEMDGGVLSGACQVTHAASGGDTIHGYGRIAANLYNEGAVQADMADAWLRLDTYDKTNAATGSIDALDGGRLSVFEIRLDNEGTMDVDAVSHLLVDAGIIDVKTGGSLDVLGTYECRRGGSIIGDGTINLPVSSLGVLGGVGQEAEGVEANQFALGRATLGGRLDIINPAATGEAAPDTGDTILTLPQGLVIDSTGVLTAEDGSTIVCTGDWDNRSQQNTDFDLLSAAMLFPTETKTDTPYNMELNAVDMGKVAAGWTDNFAVGKLTLGGDQPGRINLVDVTDSQVGDEALYLDEIEIGLYGHIGLNDLSVYYKNGGAPKKLAYGDTDLDGDVDAVDLASLGLNWDPASEAKEWATGDTDGDGDVDAVDLAALGLNWAPDGVSGSGGGVLPEPATLVLMGVGLAAVAVRGRR